MRKILILFGTLLATCAAEASPTAIPSEIAELCADRWGADYEMRVYCQKQQMEAYHSINKQRAKRMIEDNPNLFRREHMCSAIDRKRDELYSCGLGLNEATKELNATYQLLRSRLTDSSKRKLRDIQRTWMAERDLSCEVARWEAGAADVIAADVIYCLQSHSEQRQRELVDLID